MISMLHKFAFWYLKNQEVSRLYSSETLKADEKGLCNFNVKLQIKINR